MNYPSNLKKKHKTKQQSEAEKIIQAKFIAIEDVPIIIFKPDGSYYYDDMLKKGRYITVPLNKNYSIQANNGGSLTITIKGLYNYKVMGEYNIVMDAVKIDTNSLEKHFK